MERSWGQIGIYFKDAILAFNWSLPRLFGKLGSPRGMLSWTIGGQHRSQEMVPTHPNVSSHAARMPVCGSDGMDSLNRAPKIFVLDTNVILHDARCIMRFEENDVAIPMTVLEELDRFKRGNEDIHFQAREFLRTLNDLTGDVLATDGVTLGEGKGCLRVVVGKERHPDMDDIFSEDTPDHRILTTAYRLKLDFIGQRPVILVSKDTNLRLKAKSLGIPAQDYESDKIKNLDSLYSGKRVIEGVPSSVIDRLYDSEHPVRFDDLLPDVNPVANENFVLRNGSKSALATFLPVEGTITRVEKRSAYGIVPRNAEQSFALRSLMDDNIPLVTLIGKAGTGKTLLALAAALERRRNFRQIYLARPVVPLSNRDIGYLPGDIKSKLDPYMQPLFDNLSVIRNQYGPEDQANRKIQELLDTDKLLITPLAYIRGRSLQKVFFIVDEAQNLTPHEVKTIITRAGEGTKIVFTGDVHQIDHPYLDKLSNGLSYLVSRMIGQPIYAHVSLEKGERSHLADLASNLL